MKTPWPGRRDAVALNDPSMLNPFGNIRREAGVNRDFSKARELHFDHTELIAIPMTADDNGVRLMMGTSPSADKPPYPPHCFAERLPSHYSILSLARGSSLQARAHGKSRLHLVEGRQTLQTWQLLAACH
jgi:hypothetical protein